MILVFQTNWQWKWQESIPGRYCFVFLLESSHMLYETQKTEYCFALKNVVKLCYSIISDIKKDYVIVPITFSQWLFKFVIWSYQELKTEHGFIWLVRAFYNDLSWNVFQKSLILQSNNLIIRGSTWATCLRRQVVVCPETSSLVRNTFSFPESTMYIFCRSNKYCLIYACPLS